MVPIVLFGWLWNQWQVPSGTFETEHIVGESSPFLDELAPNERVGDVGETAVGDAVQSIVGDPAFFFVHPQRDDFKLLDLEIWFQNTTLPIVEFGALSSVRPDVYALYPIHNRLIEESSWDRIDEDGVVLLQRTRVYDSISAFFSDPPSRDRVATYRADFNVPFRLANYEPRSSLQSINVSLRGHHEFKTYIKNETLSFVFSYMDMNRDEGADVIRATVFNEDGEPVAQARGADDENVSDDAVASGLRTLDLVVPGLAQGVYKVVLDTTRDIFFRTITTPQHKLVFLNSLFIGDEVGYRETPRGATLWTLSGRLRMQTRHAQGVQTIRASTTQLVIEEPYEWYTLALARDELQRVDVPAGDLEIIAQGPIALSADQFFNPDPVPLTSYQSLADLGVDYVLARYTSPRLEGDWLVASVPFNVDDLYEDERAWKFSFSTPEIEALGGELDIHKINAKFSR